MALGLTPFQIIEKGTHPQLVIADDWKRIELKHIATVQNGFAFSSKLFNHNEGLPLIRIRDIFTSETQNLYSGEYKDEFIVSKGDILVGMDGDFKVSKWPGEKGLLNQRVCRILFNSNHYEKEFLFLCIQPYLDAIHSETSAVTVKHLSSRTINDIPFPLPPLPIQKAIVRKIEELFSSLDSGIADLKKAQNQLVIYRQAVLKKAFEGEAIINSKKEKLKNITSKIGSGSTPKGGQANYKATGIPLVRSLNIHFDFIKFKGLAFIDENQAEKLKNVIIQEGDVLLNITGASIGRVNIAPKEFNNGRVNQHVSIIRPKDNYFITKYLKLFIQSSKIQNWIANINVGATRQGLTKSALENLEIPLPTIKEQRQIVQEIESRLSVCDTVEKDIANSLEKAQALRQSILKKAFEGKLLSEEEIAQCKAHPDYEPASVLLEKIKAEKLAKETITKKPKKKTTIKKPPVPQKISTDIQAGVIAKVIQLHIDNPKYLDNLTHVKCEKISHLVEYHLQIPLGRVPVKDAAGPDDYNHLKKVEHRAGMAGYFKVVKKEIGHTYSSSRNIAKAIDNLESKITAEQKKQLDNLINLFLKFDLERAEIIATLYAGWNNLLIDGKTPTDDEIVYEARENWSKRKLTIDRERFYKALQWMRKDEINLIPIGFGSKVLKPKKTK